jgi:hypothetical protein
MKEIGRSVCLESPRKIKKVNGVDSVKKKNRLESNTVQYTIVNQIKKPLNTYNK